MEIQNWIHHRLFETNFQIYDPKGLKIDVEKFRSEYLKLKVWLSHVQGGVGIKLPKDHRYLMTLLACMDAGVSYVPLKENYPPHRIEQIKTETGFEVLLDEEMFHQILKGPEKNFLARQIQDQNILYIICTSGSTGRPKAVVVERSSLTHFWKWVETKFSQVSEEDRSIQVTDFTFDISLIDVGLFLSRGCALYFSEFSGNIFTLAYEVEKYGMTVLNTVVNNVNMLLDEKVVHRADFSKLHTVMMGGARFSYGLYKKCQEHLRHCGVHNLYGVTEVPVYSHCKTMNFDDSDLHELTVSAGKPLGACHAVIAKEGEILPYGERGEVLIGGGSLMREYANNPEMTRKVFTTIEGKKYYRTGDIGFQNESGDFFITGRMDDTIKYRGYRINLLDIDSYILSRAYVQDAVTVAIEDEDTQNKTICFMITKTDKSEKEVKEDLSQVLLEYQIPEHIRFVEKYPVNNNGKICKKTLKQDYLEGRGFNK